MRWRRKEVHNNGQNNVMQQWSVVIQQQSVGSIIEVGNIQSNGQESNGNTIEATPAESEASVSLHTQVNSFIVFYL